MARKRHAAPNPEVSDGDEDAGGEARHAVLERKYKDTRTAFNSWETAQARTDQHLYLAIGRLAEFAAAVGNDHDALTEFAAGKGVRATKASTPFIVTAKLIAPDDRRKASKYATVLQLAGRRGIEPVAESVAEFIKEEGGIEACVRSFRELPRESGPTKRGGRPSAFGRAVERIDGLARIAAPADLELGEFSGDYFLIVGVRNADGTTHLLRQPVTDDQAVRKAVASMVPKE